MTISQFTEQLKNHIFVICGHILQPISFNFWYVIKLSYINNLNWWKTQKKKKKNFDPRPFRSPPSFGPSDPKSDALPFCHVGREVLPSKFGRVVCVGYLMDFYPIGSNFTKFFHNNRWGKFYKLPRFYIQLEIPWKHFCH